MAALPPGGNPKTEKGSLDTCQQLFATMRIFLSSSADKQTLPSEKFRRIWFQLRMSPWPKLASNFRLEGIYHPYGLSLLKSAKIRYLGNKTLNGCVGLSFVLVWIGKAFGLQEEMLFCTYRETFAVCLSAPLPFQRWASDATSAPPWSAHQSSGQVAALFCSKCDPSTAMPCLGRIKRCELAFMHCLGVKKGKICQKRWLMLVMKNSNGG